MRRMLALAMVVLSAQLALPEAQLRVTPLDWEQGHVALGLALRRLSSTGIFMQATAHPDDENNGLLVKLNRGEGHRTVLATATRGNGGQNEIGPEIFEALGILRTEELAALHRFDGADQYFTRAVDFGFSFSIDETFEKWGKDEILGDYVRLIRTVRPDVMTGMVPEGTGGGQHHQASAILAREAFKAAGDPSRFPEQLQQGLRPWQPKKFYSTVNTFGPAAAKENLSGTLLVELATYDPLLGKTFAEIGTEARSMHKCQGMAQLLSLPGPSSSRYRLVESTLPAGVKAEERSLFDGVDTSIVGLARFAGTRPPQELAAGLAALADAVQTAKQRFDAQDDSGTVSPLGRGLSEIRRLRNALRSMPLDDTAKYEIDFRLGQKEREFQQALVIGNGVRIEALANDGVVVPGQSLRVSILVANYGPAALNLKRVAIDGFENAGACTLAEVRGGMDGRGSGGAAAPQPALSKMKSSQVGRCEPTVTVPAQARSTEPYWHRANDAGRYTFDADASFGLPYRPTPFRARVAMTLDGVDEEFVEDLPVQFRYEGNIFSGEKRAELLVVPATTVRLTPEVAIFPPARAAVRQEGAREVRVTVTNNTKGSTDRTVSLALPDQWTASPATATVRFTREDESQTVRFSVRPSPAAVPGDFKLKAQATRADGSVSSRGFQVIDYPHIRRQHIFSEAESKLKVVDVSVAPDLTVGYIMGVGDEVPAAIVQLGARLVMLGPEDLAWGDLSRFNTIVTGVRAYERREDLRANNSRLLEYVYNGGTMIVQYNKVEFNEAQYGPYKALVSSNRVTDERAPITVLTPSDPIFSRPNRISSSAWDGWVQERGLYFLGERDPKYRDLIALSDPFPYNAGEKRGALVAASYGKGTWVYVGLGLWRELPAGVDGAYQLMANLLSLGRR